MSCLIKKCLSLNKPKLFNSYKNFLSSYSLVYKNYGNPSDVLEYVETSDIFENDLKPDDLLVEFKASPVNPADINTIQGVYAIKPKLPTVAGNEGCAKILKVGNNVKNFNVGDKVILIKSTFGTWRSHAIGHHSEFFKVDNKLDDFSASQIKVNPCTAYRMLKDFGNLKQGDTVLQNGANSAVGKNVIQLAKKWNLITINVIRKRDNPLEMNQTVNELKELGANYVITEEDLESKEFMSNLLKLIPLPSLGLNCVGGTNALNCLKYLSKNSSFITYGAMSKRPFPIGAGPLIFKNLKILGFWLTEWFKQNENSKEKELMLNEIVLSLLDGSLKVTKPIEFKLKDYKNAVDLSMNGNTKGKITFVLN